MIDAGLEAVLIKVAGIGLNVKHLQRTLAELKDHLFMLVSSI
jgi:diphthine-ammonia ligase